MNYKKPYILQGKIGNNAFSYDIRTRKYITIPSLKKGTLNDVIIGDEIVFEDVENKILKSCKGLKHFIRLNSIVTNKNDTIIKKSKSPHCASLHSGHQTQHITIFDNHNHALYFWIDAIREGIIKPGAELIHIDEHSDLWPNENILDKEQAIRDKTYAWKFTNFSCNVGNYISPAICVGIIGKIIRIENEHEINIYMSYTPNKNSILNIDLDFFAPEMNFIDEEKKLKCIRHLMPQVGCITIATSPFFIDQELAIKKLIKIFETIPH